MNCVSAVQALPRAGRSWPRRLIGPTDVWRWPRRSRGRSSAGAAGRRRPSARAGPWSAYRRCGCDASSGRGSAVPSNSSERSQVGSWILTVTDLAVSVLAALSVERYSTTCVPLLDSVTPSSVRRPLAGGAPVGGDAVLRRVDARGAGAGVRRGEGDLDRTVVRVARGRSRRVERRRRGRRGRLAGVRVRGDPEVVHVRPCRACRRTACVPAVPGKFDCVMMPIREPAASRRGPSAGLRSMKFAGAAEVGAVRPSRWRPAP